MDCLTEFICFRPTEYFFSFCNYAPVRPPSHLMNCFHECYSANNHPNNSSIHKLLSQTTFCLLRILVSYHHLPYCYQQVFSFLII